MGMRKARRGERGASLVEFAVVFPVFMFIAFGVIEFTMAMTDYNALRQGVREGARNAVVADFGSDTSCPVTGGGTPSTGTRQLICLVKERADLDPSRLRVRIEWPGTYTPGQPIIVCSAFPLQSITGFMSPFLDGRMLRTEVEMRLEQINPGLTQFSESLPSNGSWDWCG